MKTVINKNFLLAGIVMFVLAFVTMSFNNKFQEKKKPWVVPDASKKMKNPVKSDDGTIAAGKTLFMKHCKSCHGAKGLGDGPKSKELDTPCGDFSAKDVADQTDGELFYKIKEGRVDMPSFKKKITEDEEIWSIINFMRTLKK